MKRFIFLVILTICFSSCKAQNQPFMKTIYEQEIDSITIKLLANNVTYPTRTDEQGISSYEEVNGAIGFVDWKTVIIHKDGREIVLDTLHVEKKETPWRLGEITGESPFPFYNIIKSYINGKKIYILLYKGGIVVLDTYIFDEKNNFKKVSKIIARSIALTAYGPPSNYAEFKKISDKICIYLSAGTQMGPKTEGIYMLNPSKDVIGKLIFSDITKNIKDEQQTFKTLDLNQNKEKVSNEIRKVLAENNNIRKNDTFRYLGYIDNETLYWEKYKNRNGILYFFYQLTLQEAKVVRYDCFNKEWLLGDYKEEEVEQP